MPVAQPFLNTPGQVGALAGYSDGMRMSYGLADLDREFRDRDLANKSNTLKYEEDLANVPLNEAQRGVKMGMAGIDQSLMDQGLVEQGKKDEFALKSQSVTQGQNKIDEATRQERAESVQEGIQILKNPSLANSEVWAEYYDKMTTKHKMRGLSPNFQDPKNAALLQAANQAYVNSAPHMRNMEAIEEKGEYAKALAEIRAKQAGENTAALLADRTKSGWEKLPADKQAREIASQEMASTGGVLSTDKLRAVAETIEKKDAKSVLDMAKEIKGDLRRKHAADGISNEAIATMALEKAKKEYDEDSMVRAWTSMGSPPIPAIDLEELKDTMPSFVALVRATPNKEAKGVFINKRDPSTPKGQEYSASGSQPAQPQPQAVTGGGLASATAEDKAEVERLFNSPKHKGRTREALYIALQNYKKRTQQAPTQAPANDVPGMPTGLEPEPAPRSLPPVMQGMGPQTPQQWVGR